MARERASDAHPMFEFGRSLDSAEDLSPQTLMFARVMGWCFDKQGRCWPGRKYFKRHGIGQKLTRMALSELEASGRIRVEKRAGPRGADLIAWTPEKWREANALERPQEDGSANALEHPQPCDLVDVSGRSLNGQRSRFSERLGGVSERLEVVQRTPLGRPELENYELSPLPPTELADYRPGGGGDDEDVSIVLVALGSMCGRTLDSRAPRLRSAIGARLRGGWTADQVVAALSSEPFPTEVKSYEGLLAHRIDRLPDEPVGVLSPALLPAAATRCPTCLGIHGGSCALSGDWSDG